MIKIFVSHTWLADANQDDYRAARQIAGHLTDENFKVWIDRSQIRPGDQIVGSISSGLGDSDCLVVLLTTLSIDRPYVREEIVRAFERNIPIVVVKQKNVGDLPETLSLAKKKGRIIEYSDRVSSIFPELVAMLNHIGGPESQSVVSESNRLIHRLGVALQESAHGYSFKADMISDVIASIQKELTDVVKQQYYSSNIGPERNYLVRAPALFRNASSVYAVSLNTVSRFWLSTGLENEIAAYYEAQGSNTIRLFVFSAAEDAAEYKQVLRRHFERYGKENGNGAVLLCSTESYERLVRSIVSHPDHVETIVKKDFAVLDFDSQDQGYTIEATLDSTTFEFREVFNKRYRFVDHVEFKRALKSFAEDFAERQRFGIARLGANDLNNDFEWQKLCAIFPNRPKAALHFVFLNSIPGNAVNVPKLLSELKRNLNSRLPASLRPSWIWIGRLQKDLPTLACNTDRQPHLLPGPWEKNYPFVMVSEHKSHSDLVHYYVDEEHGELRKDFYSRLEPDLKNMLQYLNSSSGRGKPQRAADSRAVASLSLPKEKERLVFDAAEAVAGQFMTRLDYEVEPANSARRRDISRDTQPSNDKQTPAQPPGPLRLLISKSWEKDEAEDIRSEITRSLDSGKVEIYPKKNQAYDERFLNEVDCLLLFASSATTKDLAVLEELTRAQERGVRIIPIRDPDNKPEEIALLRDLSFIPFRRGEDHDYFVSNLVKFLEGLLQKDGQFLRLTQRNRQLISLARQIQYMARRYPYRAGIIRDLLEEVTDEVAGIARGQYSTNIGIERSFLRRAGQLFSSAREVYAVSYDAISRFWRAPHLRGESNQYIEKQPSNTVRLFVFSDARSAHEYRKDLAKHNRQYGREGAVLMCSADEYHRLGVKLSGNRNKLPDRWAEIDFGVLRFKNEGNAPEVIIAMLDASSLVFYDPARDSGDGDGVRHATEIVDIAAFTAWMDGARRVRPGGLLADWRVWRWTDEWASDDGEWKTLLEEMFGAPDRGIMHLEFFADTDYERASRTVGEIRKLVDASKILLEQAWFGKQNRQPVVDTKSGGIIQTGTDRDEQFALLIEMKTESELIEYYKAIWDSHGTQKIYASLDKFCEALLDLSDGNAPLKTEILKQAQTRVYAVDYINAETFDSIVEVVEDKPGELEHNESH